MTTISITQTKTVLAAIDIAKSRHEVLIAIPGRTRRRRLTVLNQLEDFDRLIAALAAYGLPVRVAFEATGNYHRALAYRLGIAGFEVKLVSSVALARTREALNNSWDSRRDRGPSGAAEAQKRSKGCASHPAHDADRERAVLS